VHDPRDDVPSDKKRETGSKRHHLPRFGNTSLTGRMMLAGFRTADQELATEEFLVVQFRNRTLRLFDGLHLDKGKPLGTLVMFVGHNLRVLHLTNAVEKLEEVALGGIE